MNKKEYEAIPENSRFNCVLEGIAFFSSLHKTNPGYKGKDPLFITTLGFDNDAEIKKANDLGYTLKEANDSIPFPHLAIKRKLKGREAHEVKPTVVDSLQNPIPETVLIGNGSRVLVKFASYWWGEDEIGDPADPDAGVGTTLFKVQVKELVEYNPDSNVDSDLAMSEDGFNIGDHLAKEGIVAVAAPVEEVVIKEATAAGGEVTNPDIFDD